ncbi:ABC transporter substrate-binding protein [Zavarzinia sp. CC-PAN008]|uniref:ABC transporter substrate-binding protein n=1 Tax=Zavarzinia sp. CC-PAN008 TaxID=3243332 RepID=UPI003F743C3D
MLAASPQVMPAQAATPADALVMAKNIDDIITLDPAEVFEFSGGEVVSNIYDKLMIYDAEDTSKLVGGVAESWTIDGQTYTFKIRSGLTFQSGNPLTAADVAWSLQRVVKLDLTPAFILTQFGWDKENVTELVTAPDATTLVLKITADFAPTFVLNALSANVACVVDSKLALEHEADGDLGHAWLKNNSAASGAYKLVAWKPNESVSLQAFENFRAGAPTMKRVIVRHIAEPSAQLLLLQKGDIDVARNLSPDLLKGVEGNADITVSAAPKADVYYLGLNQKVANLAKPEVRQALRYLVDYQGMADSFLKGLVKVHQNFVPTGFLGGIEETPYTLDVAKAKDLLAKAGLADGFEIQFDVPSTFPWKDIGQSIQSTFGQAGIKVTINSSDQKTVITKYRARGHEMVLLYWSPDYQDPHSNADTFSRNPDNSDDASAKPLAWRNAWDIPELTAKSDAAVKETDEAKRTQLYHEIQQVVRDDSPFVIMFQTTEVTARRATVKTFVSGATFDQVYYRGITK